MTILQYPELTGLKWNLVRKVAIILNADMDQIGMSGDGDYMYLHIVRDITPTERAAIDSLMASPDPCGIPTNTGKTTIRMKDLYGMREWYFSQFGYRPELWWQQEQPDGTGDCYIEIHFDRLLSLQDKKKILDILKNSITEV